MKVYCTPVLLRRLSAMLTVVLSCSAVFCGLPEPGILIYGKITDPGGRSRPASGSLAVTYQAAGRVVTGSAEVSLYSNGMSYAIQLPAESDATNSPIGSGVLPATSSVTNFTRTFTFKGQAATIVSTAAGTDTFSLAERGKQVRVDLTATNVEGAGLEADVAPRPSGDGRVTVADWVQQGKFAIGIDVPAAGTEFQRADCATSPTLGDGLIDGTDWTQTGLYVVGLDPLVTAGGPSSPDGGSFVAQMMSRAATGQACVLRFPENIQAASSPVVVPIVLESTGNVNVITCAVLFDPSVVSYSGVELGVNRPPGATLLVNAAQSNHGQVRILVGVQPGSTFSSGSPQILRLLMNVVGPNGATTMIQFPTPGGAQAGAVDASQVPITAVGGTLVVGTQLSGIADWSCY